MNFTKLAVLAVALIAVSACNRTSKKVIGVVPKGTSDEFWQSVHAGANKAGEEFGVEIAWNGASSETNYNGQLQIVDSMINRHVDAIAIAPIDRKSLVSALDRAAAQSIPIVIFDSGIDSEKFIAQVATDNTLAGAMAADRTAKLLSGKGTVALVRAEPGAGSTMAREEGFRKQIETAHPGIKIVAEQYGHADLAKCLQITENMMTAHPDLDVVFASNEDGTVGALQAIKSRKGTKVKLVGFDWTPKIAGDLKSGLIEAVVVQDPFRMGYDSVKAAVAHMKGEHVEKIQNMTPQLVDRMNLETPEVQAKVSPDLSRYLR